MIGPFKAKSFQSMAIAKFDICISSDKKDNLAVYCQFAWNWLLKYT